MTNRKRTISKTAGARERKGATPQGKPPKAPLTPEVEALVQLLEGRKKEQKPDKDAVRTMGSGGGDWWTPATHATLSKMTDAQSQARREKQTPQGYEPEPDHWCREEACELFDGALLLVNLEPRRGLGRYLKDRILTVDREKFRGFAEHAEEQLSDEARTQYETVKEIIRRARIAKTKGSLAIGRSPAVGNGETVDLRPFLTWARGKGYAPPPALATLGEAPPSTAKISASPSIAETGQRGDILWPAIEKAMQGADGSIAQVWLKLRDLAQAKERPFIGELAQDGGLLYLDENNTNAKFSRGALSKRLKRMEFPRPRSATKRR